MPIISTGYIFTTDFFKLSCRLFNSTIARSIIPNPFEILYLLYYTWVHIVSNYQLQETVLKHICKQECSLHRGAFIVSILKFSIFCTSCDKRPAISKYNFGALSYYL